MRQLEHKLHQESVLQFPAARIYLATLSRSFRCNELHDSRLVETWIMFKHQIANTSRSKLFMSCISIYIYIRKPPTKIIIKWTWQQSLSLRSEKYSILCWNINRIHEPCDLDRPHRIAIRRPPDFRRKPSYRTSMDHRSHCTSPCKPCSTLPTYLT